MWCCAHFTSSGTAAVQTAWCVLACLLLYLDVYLASSAAQYTVLFTPSALFYLCGCEGLFPRCFPEATHQERRAKEKQRGLVVSDVFLGFWRCEHLNIVRVFVSREISTGLWGLRPQLVYSSRWTPQLIDLSQHNLYSFSQKLYKTPFFVSLHDPSWKHFFKGWQVICLVMLFNNINNCFSRIFRKHFQNACTIWNLVYWSACKIEFLPRHFF